MGQEIWREQESVTLISRSASVHCCLVVTCWERADLLAFVCGVESCFCHFPMWYLGSGMVLDLLIPDLCRLSNGGM